jgi:HEAT repeat protein
MWMRKSLCGLSVLILFIGCSTTDSDFRAISSGGKGGGTSLQKNTERLAAKNRLIGKKGDSAVVQKIVGLLQNGNQQVVIDAIQILGEMGPQKDQTVFQALAGLTASPNQWYRAQSIEALGKVGGVSAVPYVVKALDDSAGSVRYAAVKTLGELRPPDQIANVYRMMTDKRPAVRAASVRALFDYSTYVKDSGVKAQDFAVAIDDSFDLVRYVTAQALGKSYPDSLVAANLLMRAAFEDQDEAVKIEAIRSLVNIRYIDAVPMLLEIHDFVPYQVQLVISYAVQSLTGEKIEPSLPQGYASKTPLSVIGQPGRTKRE